MIDDRKVADFREVILKMGQPRPLFCLFLSFQTNNTILTTNKCKKCPSSIQRQDSNSQPSDYKSPPLTTRPGLPPLLKLFLPHFEIQCEDGDRKEHWQNTFPINTHEHFDKQCLSNALSFYKWRHYLGSQISWLTNEVSHTLMTYWLQITGWPEGLCKSRPMSLISCPKMLSQEQTGNILTHFSKIIQSCRQFGLKIITTVFKKSPKHQWMAQSG